MQLQKFCLTLAAAVVALAAMAQRVQVVDTDGLPVAYVCVTDERGMLVGTTDNDGILADARGADPLCLSHVAFEPSTVTLAEATAQPVVLTDVEFGLPEVEVKPKELSYVQTYYRMIFFTDKEGPIYFRSGVIDNTYEIGKNKVSAKTRSLSRGKSGFLRFLISTIVGRYIDRWAQLSDSSTYVHLDRRAKRGLLTLSPDSAGRQIVSDSISPLGYILTDTVAHQRTTSFNRWLYSLHRQAAEKRAEMARKGKQLSEKEQQKLEREERESKGTTNYEVYRIDDDGRSRLDDFVMSQVCAEGEFDKDGDHYMLLLQCYATGRDYIDKKEYKQLRKDNKVDMDIRELRQFEAAHNIPALPPNIQAHVDKLFEKELSK